MKPVVRIENWIKSGSSLVGDIYGHPSYTDGSKITTSRLIYLDIKGKYAETENTFYLLGSEL